MNKVWENWQIHSTFVILQYLDLYNFYTFNRHAGVDCTNLNLLMRREHCTSYVI